MRTLLILTTLLVAYPLFTAYSVLEKKDTYLISEIKASLLKPDQFQALFGTEWVLLDGRNIEGSDLAILTGFKFIPDARGKFLRMANNGIDGSEGNPENKTLGEYQEDSFKSHGHQFDFRMWGYHSTLREGNYLNIDGYAGSPADSGNAVAIAHKSVVPNGGEETRSKNITVNYFIKINKCTTDICR